MEKVPASSLIRTLPDTHLQTHLFVGKQPKNQFFGEFSENFVSYCYQSLLSCKCRSQRITYLHFLYQLRIKCCFYFSKQTKLKIPVLTHIEPISTH